MEKEQELIKKYADESSEIPRPDNWYLYFTSITFVFKLFKIIYTLLQGRLRGRSGYD